MKKVYLLLTAAAGACIMTGCSESSKDVAYAYNEAIMAGELAKANELSVTDMHNANKILVKTFSESTDAKDKLLRILRTQALNDFDDALVVEDGDYAIIYSKDGKTELCKLKKVNGAWKCFELDITKGN